MTAVQLINLALLKIGVSQGITATDEATREAWTAALVYDHALRATLRSFPWPFATKYRLLSLTQGPAWTDATIQAWASDQTYAVGDVVTRSSVTYYCILAHSNQQPPNATYWSTTATDRANGDWDYAYRWPTDCLFVRRVVPQGGQGRMHHEMPSTFRIGRDANGLLVYTHEQDATIEYTTIDCTALWTDDLWIESFTWRLGAMMAPSLSRINKMADKCWAMYLLTLNQAQAVASREQQQEKPGEAEWITQR